MPVDFGTYHHSTSEQSNAIRAWAEKEFSELLLSLHNPDSALRILDGGCGSGFLSYVAARSFPKARITAVDLFGQKSLPEASMRRAIDNMKALRMASRVSVRRHDLAVPMNPRMRYDIVVSNLVFHNLGRKRFDAYENVFAALKPGGHFIIADIFMHAEDDMRFFGKHSTLVREVRQRSSGRWAIEIKVLRKVKEKS